MEELEEAIINRLKATQAERDRLKEENTKLKEQIEASKGKERLNLIDFCNNLGEAGFARLGRGQVETVVDNHLKAVEEVNEQLDKERN